MYQLIVYVPIDSAEQVKNAIFSTGAGTLGHYSHCCFETRGNGQFLPSDQAQPAIGQPLQLSVVEELRIELFCPAVKLDDAIQRLKEAHPYEHPVYAAIHIEQR